jgi:hypothetical protein
MVLINGNVIKKRHLLLWNKYVSELKHCMIKEGNAAASDFIQILIISKYLDFDPHKV